MTWRPELWTVRDIDVSLWLGETDLRPGAVCGAWAVVELRPGEDCPGRYHVGLGEFTVLATWRKRDAFAAVEALLPWTQAYLCGSMSAEQFRAAEARVAHLPLYWMPCEPNTAMAAYLARAGCG